LEEGAGLLLCSQDEISKLRSRVNRKA
jgi:hypothetical protein